MNDYLLSVVLGIIEGLTEFLPVSSTAHLRIAQALMHVDLQSGYWKMYAIVIQLGAVLALPLFFWGRIRKFVRTWPRGERGDRNFIDHPVSLVLIAFVVTAGPAFLLKKKIGENLEHLHVMGAALLIGGIVMWAVDALFTKPRTTAVEQMNLAQAVWIGAIQILSAVFPGTSRSMSTIAAGQTAGMSRSAALEFSFFVSIPIMVVATLYDLKKAIWPKADDHIAPLHMNGHEWVVLAIGFVVSFLVALVVVAWFMGWVRKRGFAPFAIYRIVVGTAVLVAVKMGKLPA